MQIIGVDLHTRQQAVAMLNVETGEIVEKTLQHEGESVREFYSTLAGPTRVGIEATGSMQWFLELMEELGIDCQVGHPAKIRAAEPRKQKHDRRDAALVLQLLVENRFPSIWMPSREQRDVRSLILYRHQWVRIRTRVQNALQAIALSHGLRRGSSLWGKAGQQAIASLSLTCYTAERRTALQSLYRQLEEQIDDLNRKVEELAWQRPQARRLMTHPGVGPITALATETFLGEPKRFVDGKAVASYVGLIPSEHSSGGRQRLGGLSKQGNPLLRFLWCEAVGHAVRKDAELQRFYQRKLVQKGLGKAKVAAARKLGIRLWILLRDQIDYQEFCHRGQLRQKYGGAHAGMPAR
jgi:transposase